MAPSLVFPFSPYAAPLLVLAVIAAAGAVALYGALTARWARERVGAAETPAPVRPIGRQRGGYVYMLRCVPRWGGEATYALGQGERHPRLEARRAAQAQLFGDMAVSAGPWARCTQPVAVMQVVAGILSERYLGGPMFLVSEEEFARVVRLALFMVPGARLVEASFPPLTSAVLARTTH